MINGKLVGVTGAYVDEIIGAGTDEFIKKSEKTAERLESKPRMFDTFIVASIQV